MSRLRRWLRLRKCQHAFALIYSGRVHGHRLVAHVEECVRCGRRLVSVNDA